MRQSNIYTSKNSIDFSDPFSSLFVCVIGDENEGFCRVHVKCYTCGWNTVVSIPRSTLSFDIKKIYNWHKVTSGNHLMKLN